MRRPPKCPESSMRVSRALDRPRFALWDKTARQLTWYEPLLPDLLLPPSAGPVRNAGSKKRRRR